MKTLGASYNDEEYASFMAIWRYSGHLMGIPEAILFHDADDALKLYEIGLMCEPDSPIESVVMAHSLVNSAPLIAGMTEPADRRRLAKYGYRISRKLIGNEAAESLMYPLLSSFGVVGWFRLQQRYGHILSKLFPGRRQNSNSWKASRPPSPGSRPCSRLRCSTRKESATHCPTTYTPKSPASGDAGRASRPLGH